MTIRPIPHTPPQQSPEFTNTAEWLAQAEGRTGQMLHLGIKKILTRLNNYATPVSKPGAPMANAWQWIKHIAYRIQNALRSLIGLSDWQIARRGIANIISKFSVMEPSSARSTADTILHYLLDRKMFAIGQTVVGKVKDAVGDIGEFFKKFGKELGLTEGANGEFFKKLGKALDANSNNPDQLLRNLINPKPIPEIRPVHIPPQG